MNLLNTIKLPRGNMRLLNGKLPTAQYEEDEVREEEEFESEEELK